MQNETPHDAFIRLREARQPKAEKAIELMGNLGERRYQATPQEKRAMLDALYDAVDALADRWGMPGSEPADQPDIKPDMALSERPVKSGAMEDVRWALDKLIHARGSRDEAALDDAREFLVRAIKTHEA